MAMEYAYTSDISEATRFMRESAEQLRWIADLQSFLSPKLSTMARELDQRAAQLESAAASALPLPMASLSRSS
jgi:hypothetical protein